jgi:hypothetical protein
MCPRTAANLFEVTQPLLDQDLESMQARPFRHLRDEWR